MHLHVGDRIRYRWFNKVYACRVTGFRSGPRGAEFRRSLWPVSFNPRWLPVHTIVEELDAR